MVSVSAEELLVQEKKPKRANIFARLGNFLLLLVIVGNLLGLIKFSMARESVMQLSAGMYGPNRAPMDSTFLSLFLHPVVAILLGVVLIAVITKEFIFKRLKKRVLTNVEILVVLMILNGALIASYSSPIKTLGTTAQANQKH